MNCLGFEKNIICQERKNLCQDTNETACRDSGTWVRYFLQPCLASLKNIFLVNVCVISLVSVTISSSTSDGPLPLNLSGSWAFVATAQVHERQNPEQVEGGELWRVDENTQSIRAIPGPPHEPVEPQPLQQQTQLLPQQQQQQKPLRFRADGTFTIVQFADLHFGEAPDTDWGPEQARAAPPRTHSHSRP